MQVTLRPLDTITPYDKNPRHNDTGVDAVAQSLKEFGWRQPLVLDEQGVIIVGHTRYKAALKLGMTEVPVHVAVGLSPAQARAYRLADNATASLSSWNDELLVEELMSLQAQGYDLDHTGFTSEQLNDLLHGEPTEGLIDPDEIPEAKEAVTKPGDLYLLGEHRLLCGDSTSADVDKLMQGEQATMLWTDPPWNVAIGGDQNPRHRQRVGLQNDNLPPDQFKSFLDGFARNASRLVTGDCYVVLGASEWPTLDSALRRNDFHWSATVIWAKDQFVLGRSKFHRRYEPIWYGWHEKGKSSFQGRRDVDDLWEIPRPKRSEQHPTMKPIELISRAVEYSSKPKDTVLDLFGGSGSTLIACEQMHRKALLMEIDPGYCDVIVERYRQFTGKEVERIQA